MLAVIIFASFQQNIARAIDVDYYSGNDILYYDPSACSVSNQSGNVAVIGNDNAEKIFNFLTTTNFKATGDKPFNAVQAAGALGNFQQESSINPASVENNVEGSATGDGHGLAQWSYDVSGGARVGPGRRGTLMSLAQQQGKQWSDISLQFLMIQNELNNVNTDEGSRLLSGLNGEFATVTDPARASYIFQKSYERAGDPQQANRDSAANAYYTQFKDKAPSPTGQTASSSSCGSTTSSNFSTNFTFYNQCDGPWGTITPPAGTVCWNACGPTSTAMAIKNMTGQNITPLDTTQYVTQNNLWMSGGGTTFDTNVLLAQKWGLKASVISQSDSQDINYIKKILDSGGLVMVAGQAGSPRPFYQSGAHFILIRSITPDGKILIANPAPTGPDDNSKQWDAGDIVNGNLFGGVAITK